MIIAYTQGLKKISALGGRCDDTVLFRLLEGNLESLSSLRLDAISGLGTYDSLRLFSKLRLPNLRILILKNVHTREALQILIMDLPGLEELRLIRVTNEVEEEDRLSFEGKLDGIDLADVRVTQLWCSRLTKWLMEKVLELCGNSLEYLNLRDQNPDVNVNVLPVLKEVRFNEKIFKLGRGLRGGRLTDALRSIYFLNLNYHADW